MMDTQRRDCGKGSKEWKTICVIWEEANGLRAGSKTAKMKGLICQVQGVFIEYSRLSDTVEVT